MRIRGGGEEGEEEGERRGRGRGEEGKRRILWWRG